MQVGKFIGTLKADDNFGHKILSALGISKDNKRKRVTESGDLHENDIMFKSDAVNYIDEFRIMKGRLALLDLFTSQTFASLNAVFANPALPEVSYEIVVRSYNSRQSLAFAKANNCVDQMSTTGSNKSGLRAIDAKSVPMSSFTVAMCKGTSSCFSFKRVEISAFDMRKFLKTRDESFLTLIDSFSLLWEQFVGAVYLFEQVHLRSRHFNEVAEIQKAFILMVQELANRIAVITNLHLFVMQWPNVPTYVLAAELYALDENGDEQMFRVTGKPDVYVGPQAPADQGSQKSRKNLTPKQVAAEVLHAHSSSAQLEIKAPDHQSKATTLGCGPKSQLAVELVAGRQTVKGTDSRSGFLSDVSTGQAIILRPGTSNKFYLLPRATSPDVFVMQLILVLAVPPNDICDFLDSFPEELKMPCTDHDFEDHSDDNPSVNDRNPEGAAKGPTSTSTNGATSSNAMGSSNGGNVANGATTRNSIASCTTYDNLVDPQSGNDPAVNIAEDVVKSPTSTSTNGATSSNAMGSSNGGNVANGATTRNSIASCTTYDNFEDHRSATRSTKYDVFVAQNAMASFGAFHALETPLSVNCTRSDSGLLKYSFFAAEVVNSSDDSTDPFNDDLRSSSMKCCEDLSSLGESGSDKEMEDEDDEWGSNEINWDELDNDSEKFKVFAERVKALHATVDFTNVASPM